jgi:uncharacterized OB-fold protein
MTSALPPGLPIPTPENDGLSAPYWKALADNRLCVQQCKRCGTWQWGPEWICHQCLSFEMGWQDVEPRGHVYSYERVWHPVHPALKQSVPYVAVLVELPHAGGIRMLGNLLGDPLQPLRAGIEVEGVFAHPAAGTAGATLLNWRMKK